MKSTLFSLSQKTDKFILILAVFFLSLSVQAQRFGEGECATLTPTEAELQALPWYGNPNYLDNYIDSIKQAYSGNGTTIYQVEDGVRHRIPIHFWIFRSRNLAANDVLNDGFLPALPQERELQLMIDDANQAFTNADWVSWTRVYIACVDFIEANDPEVSDFQLYAVTNVNYDPNAVNVYIRAGDGGQYYANLGNARGFGYIALNRGTYGGSTSAKSFTHELGHLLDLPHTFLNHRLPCLREPVSRRSVGDGICPPWINRAPRCTITGDLLCDTEADPKMEDNQIRECRYNENEQDYRGDVYTPDATNYMSYGRKECRSRFTVNQVAVMLHKLNTRYSDFFSTPTSNNRFDTFEPNNTISAAENENPIVDRIIGSEADQIHSFHFNSCEGDWDRVDWLPVELPDGGHTETFTIRIEELDANVIGNVELFTAGMSPVGLSVPFAAPAGFTINLVPATTNVWTLTIPCDLLQGNSERLYIRVTKANNNNFGMYRVTSSILTDFELTFSSEDTKCSNQGFEVAITGASASTSVSWSAEVDTDNLTATPSVLASITALAGNRAIINSSVEGVMTLIAILRNGTGCEERFTKTFRIGGIPLAAINVETVALNEQNETCPNSSFKIRATLDDLNFPLLSIDTQEWISTNPAFVIGSPDAFGFIQVHAPNLANQSTTLIYRATNACGTTEVRTIVHTVAQLNGRIIDCEGFNGRTQLSIYPNPTKSDIKVIFKVECQECTKEELEKLYPKIDESTMVILNDAFGNVRLQYTGKQIPLDINKNIYLNLASLPFGNYVLKVITKEEVFFAHIIKD